jgi:hypothetical protein
MPEPYEPPRKGQSILERLGGRSPTEDHGDTEPVRESFTTSRFNSEDDLMLDLRLRDGSRCALSYGTLFKMDFAPEDRLKLGFASTTVIIEGRRLLPLYDLLRRHRARFIQEGSSAEEGLKPEDAAHIDRIHFENPEEENI